MSNLSFYLRKLLYVEIKRFIQILQLIALAAYAVRAFLL